MNKSFLLGFLLLIANTVFSQTNEKQNPVQKRIVVDTMRLQIACNLVDSLYKRNQFDSLYKIVSKALPLAIRSGSTPHLAKLYFRLGLYYRNKGFFEKSIQIMEKSKNLYGQLGNIKMKSNVQYALSLAYFDKGDIKTGIAMSLSNLAYYKKHNVTLFESYTYQVLSVIYGEMNNFKQQQFYTDKFFRLAQKRHSGQESIVAYNMKALLLEGQGKYKEAWKYRKQGLKLSRTLEIPVLRSGQLNTAAFNLRKQNRLDEAFAYSQEALQLGAKVNDKEIQSYSLQEMAQNQLQRGNHKNALVLALKGVSVIQLVKGPYGLAHALKNLAEVQEVTGHYQEALKTYKKYGSINDSLFSAEKMAKIAQIQSLYDLERKEETILLLTKNAQLQKLKAQQQQKELTVSKQQHLLLVLSIVVLILVLTIIVLFLRQSTRQKRQIEVQAARLEENNALKDQLFAIMGHDLRSPVASMKSSLLLMKLKNRAVEELDELENQVNGLYNTLDNLLYWSLNQQKGIRVVARSVNLMDLVYDVLEGFEGLIRQKRLVVTAALQDYIVRLDENLTVLVLRNIVHNALKFTGEGGVVQISIQEEGANFKLVVTDTGIGMDTNKGIPTGTKGRGTGLGLIVSRELMARQGGELRVESKLGKGTTVTLCWSLSEQDRTEKLK